MVFRDAYTHFRHALGSSGRVLPSPAFRTPAAAPRAAAAACHNAVLPVLTTPVAATCTHAPAHRTCTAAPPRRRTHHRACRLHRTTRCALPPHRTAHRLPHCRARLPRRAALPEPPRRTTAPPAAGRTAATAGCHRATLELERCRQLPRAAAADAAAPPFARCILLGATFPAMPAFCCLPACCVVFIWNVLGFLPAGLQFLLLALLPAAKHHRSAFSACRPACLYYTFSPHLPTTTHWSCCFCAAMAGL